MITIIAAVIGIWFAFGGPLDRIMGYQDNKSASKSANLSKNT